jgi:hypothetical protein
MKHQQNTQFPRVSQPSPDYVQTTRSYAVTVLGLVGEQIDEFVNVDKALDWFAADPRRINRDPERYAALQTRYAELTELPVHFNRIAA